MSIKRRKICLKICFCLSVVILLSAMLTGCGCTSGKIKSLSTTTVTETTTVETESTSEKTETTATEETTEETTEEAETTAPEEIKETYGNIQIQSLEGISLEGTPKLPYRVGLFSKATEAIENPLKISLKEESEKRKITFSFVSEKGEQLKGITKGVLIEKNEDFTHTREGVSYIGDIATFAINMPEPSSVEKSTVVVYEISFEKEETEYTGFISFCFQ